MVQRFREKSSSAPATRSWSPPPAPTVAPGRAAATRRCPPDTRCHEMSQIRPMQIPAMLREWHKAATSPEHAWRRYGRRGRLRRYRRSRRCGWGTPSKVTWRPRFWLLCEPYVASTTPFEHSRTLCPRSGLRHATSPRYLRDAGPTSTHRPRQPVAACASTSSTRPCST